MCAEPMSVTDDTYSAIKKNVNVCFIKKQMCCARFQYFFVTEHGNLVAAKCFEHLLLNFGVGVVFHLCVKDVDAQKKLTCPFHF